MTSTRAVRLTLAACLVAAPALAQTESPRVSRGRPANSLSLLTDGRRTEIPLAAITLIARPNDGLGNGALIGFGSGAIVGFLASTVGMESGDECELTFGPCGGPQFSMTAAQVFGAVGTGLGVLVDALIRRDRVLYRRASGSRTYVTPLIGPHVRGAQIGFSW